MYDNYSNLHYPGGREAWLQQLKDAQHDPARWAGLCNFAAALIERGDPLPQEMRGFIADYLRGRTPKIKRSPSPGPNLNARNDLMTFAAAHLVVGLSANAERGL